MKAPRINLPPKTRSFLGSAGGKLAAGLGSVAVALVVAMLSPLQDVVRDLFRPEKIEVSQAVNVVEGEPTPLTVVLQDRSGGAGLSGGVVRIVSPEESIVLHGPAEFAYPASEGSATVAPEGGLRIEARTFGRERLLVEVATNKGKTFKGQITVVSRAKAPEASERDFSGAYRVILNDEQGQMTLTEVSTNQTSFSGQAQMESGKAYDVTGWRDGSAFFAKFDQAGATAFRIDGIYCQLAQEGVTWMVVNAKVQAFVDGREKRTATPAHTVRERCPDYPAGLADLPGDGRFFAMVRMR